jgi:hypothetical protein
MPPEIDPEETMSEPTERDTWAERLDDGVTATAFFRESSRMEEASDEASSADLAEMRNHETRLAEVVEGASRPVI